jgi:Winged helix-turn helix
MWTRFAVAAHLSADELAAHYRAARDPVERSRWQMIWLLVAGRPLKEVAAVTGFSARWIRAVVKAYNATGAPALADQRHRNAGAAPLLDAAGRQALDEAAPGWGPVDRTEGGAVDCRASRPPARRDPAEAADPAAQAAFQKRSTRRLKKNGRRHPTGSSGRKTSTGRA